MTNPCGYWIEYSGETGKFKYYKKGKEKGSGENIEVDMSNFIVLDTTLFTVSGFSKKLDTGVYSNECRDLDNGILKVKSKGNLLVEGTWKEIKDRVSALNGPGYTKSVYILIPVSSLGEEGDEWVLANVKFKGSSLNAWIEFCNNGGNKSFGKYVTCVTGKNPKKNGNVNYFEPILEVGDEIPANYIEIAYDEDRELQKYLSEYLKLGDTVDHSQDNEYNPEDENQEIVEGDGVVEVSEEDQQWEAEQHNEEPVINHGPEPTEEPEFDTDDWASYKPKSAEYPVLGKCSLDQLKEMKETLEANDFTGELVYHLIIRALAEKSKESKKTTVKKPPF